VSSITRGTIAVILAVIVGAAFLVPASGAAVAAGKHPIYQATLRVQPRCLSVSRKHRRLRITFRHGVRHVDYRFALLPLFGKGKITVPSMGRHKASKRGSLFFTFPAPNHKRDRGRWQVTATRKLGHNRFKLAALAHFRVRQGKCRP